MPQTSDLVDRVRVATPCTASWEKMHGNDRVRFCEQCNLNVYNFSALTRQEITTLVTQTEGRLCGRLYRRADGTLLTRDCPTGVRGWYQRLAQRAGATLALLFGLTSGVVAQQGRVQKREVKKTSTEAESCVTPETPVAGWKIERSLWDKNNPKATAKLTGVLLDQAGAIIGNLHVKLRSEDEKYTFDAVSDSEGNFSFANLPAATYTLEIITSTSGFKSFRKTEIKVAVNELIQTSVTLSVAYTELTGVVGIAEIPIPVEPTTEITNHTKIIQRKP